MNQAEKALALARSIGGKNRLNCIAELDEPLPGRPGRWKRTDWAGCRPDYVISDLHELETLGIF